MQIDGKWLRMCEKYGLLPCTALVEKVQKMWICAEDTLPNR